MFLTSSQFLLLNALVRRDAGTPQAIPVPTEYAARELAAKELVSIVPMDDLGMLWVRVTEAGRQHGQRMPNTYVEQIAVAS